MQFCSLFKITSTFWEHGTFFTFYSKSTTVVRLNLFSDFSSSYDFSELIVESENLHSINNSIYMLMIHCYTNRATD